MVATVLVLAALPRWAHAWPAISEWGPGGTLNHATSPTYTLPIPVLDAIRATVRPGPRRRAWVQVRDAALAEWGIPFVAQDASSLAVPEATWTPYPGSIVLERSQVFYGQDHMAIGTWLPDSGSGLVVLSLDQGWYRWQGAFQSWVAHEIGHTLGFGHPYADNFGGTCPVRWVMGCGLHVADDERDAVQAYYGWGG